MTVLQIVPGSAVDPLGGKVMERIETFYDRVQQQAAPDLGTGAKPPVAAGDEAVRSDGAAQSALKPEGGETKQALHMLERAFSFAIEATLMSKVSTESTRIFNTFLRGQ